MSEEKLKALYYDPKKGFLPLTKLWQRVKEDKIPLSYNDVRKIPGTAEAIRINETSQETKRIL